LSVLQFEESALDRWKLQEDDLDSPSILDVAFIDHRESRLGA
jgi:hypothetical protein